MTGQWRGARRGGCLVTDVTDRSENALFHVPASVAVSKLEASCSPVEAPDGMSTSMMGFPLESSISLAFISVTAAIWVLLPAS